MTRIKHFKDLRVWQKAMEVTIDVYRFTHLFPREETYGLISQTRKSAVSIPSNIAEGFKWLHRKEYQQFLHVASGSVAELETQLILAAELGYFKDSDIKPLSQKVEHLARMISALLVKVRQSIPAD